MFFGLDTQVKQSRLPVQLRIDSLSDYSAHIAHFFKPSRIAANLDPRRQSRLDTVDLGPLRLIYCVNDCDVDILSPAFDNRFLLHIPMKGSFSIGEGFRREDIDVTKILLVKPGRSIRLRLPAGVQFVVVQIERQAMIAHLDQPNWGQAFDPHGLGHLIAQRTKDMAPLFTLLSYLYFEGARYHLGEASRQLGEAMAAVLGQRLAACFYGEPVSQATRHQAIFENACNHIASASPYETLRVGDIARGLNVSPRTLQRAFKEMIGQSPLQWTMQFRLQSAHALLLEAGNESQSVTQVAMSLGFADLSRFARLYRLQYGETPSATLRTAKG